jgi:hypothetical protein
MILKFYKFLEAIKNSHAKKNKFIIISTLLSLFINIGLWLLLYFELKKIITLRPDLITIPLHYNVFFGIDLIGKWQQAFWLPVAGIIILIFNFILAWLFFSKKVLTSYFLCGSMLLIQIILFISGILIILINL